MPYTILIADDNAAVRHSLRSCLEQHNDWQVCGEAENGKEAVEKVTALHPDVVILDFQMPVLNGLEAARQISIIAPNLPILMLTLYKSEQLWWEAQAAGIREVISKSDGGPKQLLVSLRCCQDESGA